MTRSSVQLECKTQGKSNITIVKGVGTKLWERTGKGSSATALGERV